VAVAAVVVFSAWLDSSGTSGHPAVVATQPLAVGSTLAPGDLGVARVHLPATTAAHTFSSPSLIVGRILGAPLAPGELIQSSDLVASGQAPPLRPVAVTINASDASILAVGDLVDVVVTDGTNATSTTTVLLRGARVVTISTGAGGLVGQDNATVVTLGVATLQEVTEVIHAQLTATVSVVVGEQGDGTGLSPANSSPTTGGPSVGLGS
jgi:Flp pilus assembly protein CpaB